MTPGTATVKNLESSSARTAGWLTFADALDRIQTQDERDHEASQEEREQELRRRDLLQSTGVIDQVMGQVATMPVIGGKRLDFMTLGPKVEPAISIMETSGSSSSINVAESWIDIEFEVALDSGAQDHVCAEDDAPGYELIPSVGSESKQCFIVGDGGRLANMGEKRLNLEPEDCSTSISSCFQIARVTRPLMSVGWICDGKAKVIFEETTATVLSREGKEICVFNRKPGGLYLCKMRLKQPFPRPE